jgi:ribosome recycling factor
MSIIINEIETEVSVSPSNLPLTPQQIDLLVRLVLQKLEEKQREQQQRRADAAIRPGVARPATEGR